MSGTIKAAIQALKSRIADAYTAVSQKGGTLPVTQDSANLPSAIASIPSGGAPESAPSRDVNFFDYTGFIVASYTQAELLQLTELPTPREYDGLTFLNWSMTLAEIKTLVQNNEFVDVMALYTTTDGKHHIEVDLQYGYEVSIYINLLRYDSLMIIDWGDGTQEEHTRGTYSHTYSNKGQYTIKLYISPNDRYGDNIFDRIGVASVGVYGNNITGIYISKEHTADAVGVAGDSLYTLSKCSLASASTNLRLRYSMLPYSMPYYMCPSAKFAFKGWAAGGNYAYDGCYYLRHAYGTTGTVVPAYTFRNCRALERVVLPDTITEIRNGFDGTSSLTDIYIYSATPPTLTVSTAITVAGNATVGVKIHIKSGTRSAYEAMTNWASTFANSRITVVEDL